ncbi:hypothetical protein BC940DRAFT_304227 [Gongronella butleri]|nr:hypothetical protein BC940DRAFT_304227 [Gongronella butleri]
MWKVHTLFVLALVCLGLASAQDAKTQRLTKLAQKNNGLVKLDSDTYFKYTQGSREYGLVVLLTALSDQMRCYPCREFDPEYRLVAKSFQNTKFADNLFFGHLDFFDGQAVYQQLGLQTAPTIFYFPPSSAAKNDVVKYDLGAQGFQAEPFAEFVSRHSGYPVPVTRPLNYFKLATNVFLGLGALAVVKLLFQHFSFILYHKNTWTAITLFVVLIMTSGHMFNRIRNTPYAHTGPTGQLNYVAQGFTSQFGIETQIVASMYGVLSFAVIAMAKSVPRLEDKVRQRVGVYIWITCFFVIFSCLLSFFRIKNGGYPFQLLF